MRIDSPSNPRVAAAVRALARGERMPLEGERMLGEALESGVVPETVFFAPDADEALLRDAASKGASLAPSSRRVIEKLSDLPSARGLVALATPPARTLHDVAPHPGDLLLLLDGVQDPSNVGAILRSAEAFGVRAALLLSGSASPFSARALRASAGSALRVPIVAALAPEEAVRFCREGDVLLVGAEAHGGGPPKRPRTGRAIGLVLGSEGHGLTPALEAALEIRVTIPLAPRVESLNAAVAAALLLYELSGRRRG